MSPFEAKAGSSATSSKPPWPRASTAGSPVTGAESFPSADNTRSRPGRSVISILPPGRNARPHGFCRPSTTVTTSKATPAFFSGASVCPACAGFCSGLFAGRGSTWAKTGDEPARRAMTMNDEILITADLTQISFSSGFRHDAHWVHRRQSADARMPVFVRRHLHPQHAAPVGKLDDSVSAWAAGRGDRSGDAEWAGAIHAVARYRRVTFGDHG